MKVSFWRKNECRKSEYLVENRNLVRKLKFLLITNIFDFKISNRNLAFWTKVKYDKFFLLIFSVLYGRNYCHQLLSGIIIFSNFLENHGIFKTLVKNIFLKIAEFLKTFLKVRKKCYVRIFTVWPLRMNQGYKGALNLWALAVHCYQRFIISNFLLDLPGLIRVLTSLSKGFFIAGFLKHFY